MSWQKQGKRRNGKNKKFPLWFYPAAGIALGLALVLAFANVPYLSSAMQDLLGIRPPLAQVAQEINSPTKVHIIDVMQGDAALLEQDGYFALIDAGPPEGQDNLLAYLHGVGVTSLEYVVMTHPHADHYGGMLAVVQQFTVHNLILPDLELAPYPTAAMFTKLLEGVLERGVTTITAKQGDVYPLGGGSITVVHGGLATDNNYNLLSLGLLFEANGFRFLDTGDAEAANEKAMLQSGVPLRAEVFMAGHHGSSTSNTKDFLAAIRPSVVVVSLGAGNSYGHPHREALEAYEQEFATVLRTDQNGCVVVAPGENGEVVYAVSSQ